MTNKKWGGFRVGAGRASLNPSEKKKCAKIYICDEIKENIVKYGIGNSFSEKAVELVVSKILDRKESNILQEEFVKNSTGGN